MLVDALSDFLKKYLTDYNSKKYLLAVSGGMDSMLLLHLFQNLQLNIAVAHCNFNLRGEESMADEFFVTEKCNQLETPCYVHHFDMRNEKEHAHEGTQLVARTLRYNWFEELRQQLGFDYICTAHHQRDNAETLIHRFMLGAYPESMQGIKPVNGNLIRPMLFIPYKQLVTFAGEKNVSFRTDSSNLQEDYTRNKIRHSVLPVLEKVFGEEYQKNLENITLRYSHYYDFIQQMAVNLLHPKRFWYEIKIIHLLEVKGSTALLYETLKNFGFNWIQCDDICANLHRTKGTFFENDERSFRLYFTNEILQLVPVRNDLSEKEVAIHEVGISKIELPDVSFTFQTINRTELQEFEPRALYFDADLFLTKRFTLRFWQAGDHFIPLGMPGNKSVADFLKDKGVSPAEKEYCRVLCYNNMVIGVLGYRIDDSYKITETTVRVVIIRIAIPNE